MDSTPLVTDPTLGIKVSAPFSTKNPSDFPNETIQAPQIVDSATGAERNETPAEIAAGKAH